MLANKGFVQLTSQAANREQYGVANSLPALAYLRNYLAVSGNLASEVRAGKQTGARHKESV